MPVKAIRAVILCDRCGVEFSVAIEETTIPVAGWSMWDVAEDAVRGSLDYAQTYRVDRIACLIGHLSSVQQGQMLCADCTASVDREETP